MWLWQATSSIGRQLGSAARFLVTATQNFSNNYLLLNVVVNVRTEREAIRLNIPLSTFGHISFPSLSPRIHASARRTT